MESRDLKIHFIFRENENTWRYAKFAYEQPNLEQKEILRCIKRYQQGDMEAGGRVVLAHLKYVHNIIACEFYIASQIDNVDDCVQEGTNALYDAMEHYDPEFGASFATYASYWVKKRIYEYLCTKGAVSVNEKIHRKIMKLKVAEMEYEMENGRKPTLAELSEILNENYSLVSATMWIRWCLDIVMLDSAIENGGDEGRMSIINTDPSFQSTLFENVIDQYYFDQQFRKEIYEMFPDGMKRDILKLFLEPDSDCQTHRDCAEKIGVSRQYISRMVKSIREILLEKNIVKKNDRGENIVCLIQ